MRSAATGDRVAKRAAHVLVECAWCRKRLPAKAGLSHASGEVSHGMCAPCARRLLRRRDARST